MVKQTLWLSDPSQIANFLSAETEQDKFNCTTAIATTTDMTTCGWVKVGTATLTLEFDNPAPIREAAVDAVDLALDQLEKTFKEKRNILEELRQTFLCLEAPLSPSDLKADNDF